METPDIKELFYEADTRKHQQWVAEQLIACAKRLLDRAVSHDASKFSEVERKSYVEPVWELNTREVEYRRLTAQMGEGWEHHKVHNTHHPEFVLMNQPEFAGDPFSGMDLFDLLEMLCDWIAASKRRGNLPSAPIERFRNELGLDHQLECVLRNTLGMMMRTAERG
jgi:hypothetical protein